jgi:hypothetical protein
MPELSIDDPLDTRAQRVIQMLCLDVSETVVFDLMGNHLRAHEEFLSQLFQVMVAQPAEHALLQGSRWRE